MSIMQAMRGVLSATVAALCLGCSLQKYLEQWPTAVNEHGRSVSVVMKRPTIRRVELHTFHL